MLKLWAEKNWRKVNLVIIIQLQKKSQFKISHHLSRCYWTVPSDGYDTRSKPFNEFSLTLLTNYTFILCWFSRKKNISRLVRKLGTWFLIRKACWAGGGGENKYRREYTVNTYFLQNISWNTYLAIVSLCKLPRNVHDALFEIFHELWKFWKSIFRISLSWKTLLLNLFPCLINSFVINDVYKSLKRKCKHYVKANKVVILFYVTKFEGYWR